MADPADWTRCGVPRCVLPFGHHGPCSPVQDGHAATCPIPCCTSPDDPAVAGLPGSTLPAPGMAAEEAGECFRAIVLDTDDVRRAMALSSLAAMASYVVVYPSGLEQLVTTLRMLRDRTPWPETEDHRV